jgi:D-alanyl-D-alanine dipeptidase
MWRYQRKTAKDTWMRVGDAVPVNLGRTGLAWGRSALTDLGDPTGIKGPQKREGDGKSPAGLFPILQAFGHPKAPKGYKETNLPFLVVEGEQCVDDSTSPYYNQVVDPSQTGGVTWLSAEKMKIDLYRMGLVIGHNCPDASPGLGSCIFFHLQRGPKDPTSGCTSMDTGSLTSLLLWLKKDAEPVLLQLPRSEFERIADKSWPKP